MKPLRIFAACAPGIEPLLLDEVRALGFERASAVAGGVEMEGDLTAVYRANLELGLATHVLVRLGSFRAVRFDVLVHRAAELAWERWLAPEYEVRVRSRESRLYHTGAVEERIRDAIRERLQRRVRGPDDRGDETDRKPRTDRARKPRHASAGVGPAVHVRIVDDMCTLSIDTSGEPLHRRGYRLASGKAPLREDLARALVIASRWEPGTALVDPFAGAGTIPIEAAILARGLPPGRLREFAFMHGPCFFEDRWERVMRRAVGSSRDRVDARLHASDRDAGAIEATRANAARAGVGGDLEITSASLSAAAFLGEPAKAPPRGAVVTDPPHGRRTGDERTLRRLYQKLGDLYRRLPEGWRLGLAAEDRRLAQATGVELESVLLTDAGGTKLRFLRDAPRDAKPARSGPRRG